MGFLHLQRGVNWYYHSLGIVYAVMLLRFHRFNLPSIARRHDLTAQQTSALTIFPPLCLQYSLGWVEEWSCTSLPCSQLFSALLFLKSVSEGSLLRSLTFVSLSSFTSPFSIISKQILWHFQGDWIDFSLRNAVCSGTALSISTGAQVLVLTIQVFKKSQLLPIKLGVLCSL